jgi:hypothetical protein
LLEERFDMAQIDIGEVRMNERFIFEGQAHTWSVKVRLVSIGGLLIHTWASGFANQLTPGVVFMFHLEEQRK